MTGKSWEQDRQRTSRTESNSGHHETYAPLAKSDDFATFFTNKTTTISSQFSAPHVQELIPTTSTANTPLFSFCPLSEAEVSKLLLSSHPTTRPLDPIPSHLLQAISPALLPALTHIINTSLLTGTFPTAFNQARNSSLDANQSGFRSGHSTKTADISEWMKEHHLQLTLAKTELLVFPATLTLQHDFTIHLGLPYTTSERSGPSGLDNKECPMARGQHKRRSGQLTNLSLARSGHCCIVTKARVISRLDYCNALPAGLPLCTIKPLQMIQNAAARPVFNEPKRAHNSHRLGARLPPLTATKLHSLQNSEIRQ
ncbi:putative glycine dehydrogenase (decarboxylating) subunit 1 [Labeo rohita]|uniref:Glycine dehydrogenase (Decarboxylating) subunit 1 n=1 Tax=Labeo rohita TaxID=84645 RepID=A0ABQ8N0A2_LABRO|nr:putative glycine dehydrogenase (decarboxylating) subunit 1 [Labeo rohita]